MSQALAHDFPGERFLGIGVTGIVVQRGDKALKKPREYDTTKAAPTRKDELKWLMEVSRMKMRTEIQVYKHLGDHDGIIKVFHQLPIDHDDDVLRNEPVLVMPYMKNGTLQGYLSVKEPDHLLQDRWIRSLASTVAFCHNQHVLLADIGSRNCLLADDLSLKLCDFGESTIIPFDLNMTEVNDNGVSVKTDIAQFGSLVYEISTRINLSDPRQPRLHFVEDEIKNTSQGIYEDSEKESDDESDGGYQGTEGASDVGCTTNKALWPQVQDLPSTEKIRFGTIIQRSWTKGYGAMDQLITDLGSY
jgi:serine/threonine protein kinase